MYNKADALKEVRFKLRTERQVAVRQAEKEGGGKKVLGRGNSVWEGPGAIKSVAYLRT